MPPGVPKGRCGIFRKGRKIILAAAPKSASLLARPFDPEDAARELSKSGLFVPGVRPLEQTAAYLKQVWLRLTLPGALYMCVLCVPLELLIGRFGLPNNFTGAAIMGMVTLILGIITHLASVAILVTYEEGGLIRRARPSR